MHHNQQGDVPRWAHFFNARQYARFMEIVQDYFRNKDLRIDIDDGLIRLPAQVGNKEDNAMGLQNIAELCAQIPPDQWVDALDEHFTRVLASQEEGRWLEKVIDDFTTIREMLVLRLFPDEYLQAAGGKLTYRRDIPGTISALAFDLANAFRTVSREEAARWQVQEEQLFDLALNNTRKLCDAKVESIDIGDDMQVMVLTGESMMISSVALMLEEFPETIGRHGTLLGVPSRAIVLAYPIADASVLQVVPRMVWAISSMYRQGPWSVSPQLYWYHSGNYTPIPYELVDGKLNIEPPESFVVLLNELTGGEPPTE